MAEFTPKLIDTHGRKKSAQEIQDDIFRKMSADERLEIGAQLWILAKELDSKKINYAKNRSAALTRKNRRNS